MSEYPPPDPFDRPHRSEPPQRSIALSLFLAAVLGGLGAIVALRWMDRGAPAVEPRLVTPRGALADEEMANIQIFQAASPSVVYITTIAERRDFWRGRILEVPQGTGSGFIWDNAGHIVTNFHVVQDVARGQVVARVTLADHSTYDAELVGAAPDQDVAVLRINAPASKLPPLPVGSSQDLLVGQKVFAVGNPFGLDQTLTTGVVSALGRSITSLTRRPIDDVIQTDAAINPGNSGGPLLDSAGRLVGVNTAIYSPSGAYAGIGFAVPVDTVNRVVPQLIDKGHFARADLGIVPNDRISAQILANLGVEGLLVIGVRPGSAADAAGIQGLAESADGRLILGDIILTINGTPVRTSDDLYRALSRFDPGDTVTLTLLRDRKKVETTIQLDAAPVR